MLGRRPKTGSKIQRNLQGNSVRAALEGTGVRLDPRVEYRAGVGGGDS